MTAPRPPKKSDVLEIRLPHEAKGAFMARCRAEGRSASESLRGYIDQQIAQAPPQHRPRRRKGWVLLLAGLAAGGLAATALPSLARPNAHSSFQALDANHDHLLTEAEFNARR